MSDVTCTVTVRTNRTFGWYEVRVDGVVVAVVPYAAKAARFPANVISTIVAEALEKALGDTGDET